MPATVVDELHESFSGLLSVLDAAGEVSLRAVADENFRKSLLLAAASYFERRMTDTVMSSSNTRRTATCWSRRSCGRRR